MFVSGVCVTEYSVDLVRHSNTVKECLNVDQILSACKARVTAGLVNIRISRPLKVTFHDPAENRYTSERVAKQ